MEAGDHLEQDCRETNTTRVREGRLREYEASREALATLTDTADRWGCRRGRSKASSRRTPHTSGLRERRAKRDALQLP